MHLQAFSLQVHRALLTRSSELSTLSLHFCAEEVVLSNQPIRVREFSLGNSGTMTDLDNGSPTGWSIPYVGWGTFYWYFLDQINPRVAGGRRAVGKAKHIKVQATLNTHDVMYKAPNNHIVYEVDGVAWRMSLLRPAGGQNNPFLSFYGWPGWSNLSGVDFQSTPNFSNLCLSAFNKQITQIPALISIFNFAYEFKDFKPLLEGLRKIPKLLKEGTLQKQVSKPALKPRQLPKKVAKSGVDTFLSWNFQWAPLIGDLQKLTTVADDVIKKLTHLQNTKGKEVTVRYNVPDCYVNPSVGQVVHTMSDDDTRYERVVLESYRCDFNSSWRLFQDLNELYEASSGFKATLAVLGINNPAKIVWNAIPFSFMLDWVAPFGKWLERAAVQPFTGTWDVSQACCSYKEKFRLTYLYTSKRLGTTTQLASVDVEKYTRLDGIPFTLGAVDFAQLTDTQQKLALSIPLSRVLK